MSGAWVAQMRALAKGRQGSTYQGASTLVSIRLTKVDIDRLRKVASDQDRSLSAVCRRLIMRGLPDEEALDRE